MTNREEYIKLYKEHRVDMVLSEYFKEHEFTQEELLYMIELGYVNMMYEKATRHYFNKFSVCILYDKNNHPIKIF